MKWIDLSTFDVAAAQAFYTKVFGWEWFDDGQGYLISYGHGWLTDRPVAGLYEMPVFFQNINMPSFWMSYVQVDDIAQTVALATQLGGRIEMEDTTFIEGKEVKVALIRDPMGAGFTCFQGSIPQSIKSHWHGSWLYSDLYVSEGLPETQFYQQLFGWQFTKEVDGSESIYDAHGELVAQMQVLPNSVKGDKEYWSVSFAVTDIKKAIKAIVDAGGQCGEIFENESGRHSLAYDNQGAAFFVSEQ